MCNCSKKQKNGVLQAELEKEKSKKDDGAGAWIERSRKLEAEVDWAKEVSDRLERVNQALKDENARLRSQFKSQEDDRNFLIKQTVTVKKENARLRIEYERLEQENKALQSQVSCCLQEKWQCFGKRFTTMLLLNPNSSLRCARNQTSSERP